MNLDIVSKEIGRHQTLGILGTELAANGCQVQFIFKLFFDYNFRDRYLVEELEKELGAKVTALHSGNMMDFLMFSTRAIGGLRNPRGFLGAMAKKVAKAQNLSMIRYARDEANDLGDTGEWCRLSGAPRSPLNEQ